MKNCWLPACVSLLIHVRVAVFRGIHRRVWIVCRTVWFPVRAVVQAILDRKCRRKLRALTVYQSVRLPNRYDCTRGRHSLAVLPAKELSPTTRSLECIASLPCRECKALPSSTSILQIYCSCLYTPLHEGGAAPADC